MFTQYDNYAESGKQPRRKWYSYLRVSLFVWLAQF
jgi:hypothetical protein